MTKGIRVKRPLLLLVFGLILIGATIYTMLFTNILFEDLRFNLFTGSILLKLRAFANFLLMGGFLLVIGGISIFQATIPCWIMKIELKNGKSEILSLKEIIKSKRVTELSKFLQGALSLHQVRINKQLNQKV